MKYKVSDLSKILGVTTNTIRSYEKEGYIKSERDESNYRWYKSFDICRTAVIRLFIKCGFAHADIKQILDSTADTKHNICTNQLDAIDKELKRLHFLRHWLKDNIQLMDTIKNIGDGFTTMDCPALKYIIYSKGDKILGEVKRLNTINDFMYNIPEIQLIKLFKLKDLNDNKFICYNGWAMKEIDIKRLNVENIITDDNLFIEYYPVQKCLYGAMNISSIYMNDEDKLNETRINFFKKAHKYMKENNMEITGDVTEIMVNVLTDTVSSLVCIPFKYI